MSVTLYLDNDLLSIFHLFTYLGLKYVKYADFRIIIPNELVQHLQVSGAPWGSSSILPITWAYSLFHLIASILLSNV